MPSTAYEPDRLSFDLFNSATASSMYLSRGLRFFAARACWTKFIAVVKWIERQPVGDIFVFSIVHNFNPAPHCTIIVASYQTGLFNFWSIKPKSGRGRNLDSFRASITFYHKCVRCSIDFYYVAYVAELIRNSGRLSDRNKLFGVLLSVAHRWSDQCEK